MLLEGDGIAVSSFGPILVLLSWSKEEQSKEQGADPAGPGNPAIYGVNSVQTMTVYKLPVHGKITANRNNWRKGEQSTCREQPILKC